MNKNAILKTVVSRWDNNEQCYVVESPLCDRILGAAKTEEEARQLFEELLNDLYEDYLNGQLSGYDKPGRPKKGKVGLHAEVNPGIKKSIAMLAKEFGISQGEALEYLYSFYEAQKKA